MNPAGLLVDKYSYMSQPYSFYYFHHMDELGLRTDWIRRGQSIYPLSDPAKDFTLQYDFEGGHYSIEDYFERNFVTGFLVLHDNHIAVERYSHGADPPSGENGWSHPNGCVTRRHRMSRISSPGLVAPRAAMGTPISGGFLRGTTAPSRQRVSTANAST